MATEPSKTNGRGPSPRRLAQEPGAEGWARMHKRFVAPIPPKDEIVSTTPLPGALLYGRTLAEEEIGPLRVPVSPKGEYTAAVSDTKTLGVAVPVGEPPT